MLIAAENVEPQHEQATFRARRGRFRRPAAAAAGEPPKKKRTLADLLDDGDDCPSETAPEPPQTSSETEESSDRTAPHGKRSYMFDPVEADSGPAVLIVDDSSMSRQMVRSVVEKLGCTPVEATDGIQAIAQARFHEPVLIVLDVVMPGQGGIETLQELRQDSKLADIPVIMLTSESDRAKIQSALMANANDYLVKPVNLRELEKRIKQYVN